MPPYSLLNLCKKKKKWKKLNWVGILRILFEAFEITLGIYKH